METNLPSDNIQAELNKTKRLLDAQKAKLEEQMKAASFTDKDAYINALNSPVPAPASAPTQPNQTGSQGASSNQNSGPSQPPAGQNTQAPQVDTIIENGQEEEEDDFTKLGTAYYTLLREQDGKFFKKKDNPELVKAKRAYDVARVEYFENAYSHQLKSYDSSYDSFTPKERQGFARDWAMGEANIKDSNIESNVRLDNLGEVKKNIFHRTMGLVAKGADIYRDLGNMGPGISIGKNGIKRVKSGEAEYIHDAYVLTVGKVGRSLLLGLISGGTTFAGNAAWNISRRVANMTIIGTATSAANNFVDEYYKDKQGDVESERVSMREAVISGEGSFERYIDLNDRVYKPTEEKIERKERLARASVALLAVGLGYGLNAAENSDRLSFLSGKVHTDTPEKGGTGHHNNGTKEGKISKNTSGESKATPTKPIVDQKPAQDTVTKTEPSEKPAAPAPKPDQTPAPAAPAASDANPSAWTAPKAPELTEDKLPEGAVIGEGNVSIIHAFKTQLEGDKTLAEHFKYPSEGTSAQKAAFLTNLAKKFGYIGEHGESVGVKAGMGEAFVLRAVEHNGEYAQFADEYQTVDGTTTLMQTHAENTVFDASLHKDYEYTHTGAHAPVANPNPEPEPEPEHPNEQPQPTGAKTHETTRPHGGARPKLGDRTKFENPNARPDGNSLLNQLINHTETQSAVHDTHEYHRGGYSGERYNPEMDTNPHYLTESEKAQFLKNQIPQQERLAKIAIVGQSGGKIRWVEWLKFKETSVAEALNKDIFPKWWQPDPHHLRHSAKAVREMVKNSSVRPYENEKVADYVQRVAEAAAQKKLEVFINQPE